MMPWPCLADYVDWPMVIAVVVALLPTALMLCCIWVASDADDYSENRREKDDCT